MDKKQFWEEKILNWEKKRYGKLKTHSGVLQFFRKKMGTPLQYRMQFSAEIMASHLSMKNLLDIGCGTGIFYQKFLYKMGIGHYTGIDLSTKAIEIAKKKAIENNNSDRATFLSGDIKDMDLPPVDIIVGLGLLDWLAENEIESLFKKIYPCRFLFSISENKRSFAKTLHFLYVYLSYGWKTEGYVPRYHSVDQIISLAHKYGFADIHVFRDKRLGFGAIIYNL